VLFIAVFLRPGFHFTPFPTSRRRQRRLSKAAISPISSVFSTLFLSIAAWAYCHEPRRLTLAVRPILMVTILWCVVTVATSWEPSLAAAASPSRSL